MVRNDKGGKDKDFLSFIDIKEGNDSHHLIFWLLETLIGLRVQVRRLIM